MYRHIRKHHDNSFYFGTALYGSPLSFFSPSGKTLHFNEASKNSIDEDERITIAVGERRKSQTKKRHSASKQRRAKSRVRLPMVIPEIDKDPFSRDTEDEDQNVGEEATGRSLRLLTVASFASEDRVGFPREGRYYCPYVDCRYSEARGYMVTGHIRRMHFPLFPQLMGKVKYIFKTTSGRIIRLDGNSRNLLKEGEEFMTEKFYAEGDIIRYCPFKGCTTTSTYVTHIYSHLRAKHGINLPKLTAGSAGPTFRTPSGQILLFDENSCNILDDGEDVIIEGRVGGNDPDTAEKPSFYCPYKSCNGANKYRGGLYLHIRRQHDKSFFVNRNYQGREQTFTTPSGEEIHFDVCP
ncbi:hypothetical protein BDB00DRAFT_641421 [Zychaea mexicana]|uniref:uncharacterized protein n=1 Tax=Zychaea mexicana TaxID=64656 RepID=UPI0022FF4418|nr:uncharacterized protein BDB00DRAFT_641421 [Zychaea mexicana]KAI9489062.1 hypothetical protein BDB00DRAFT_641421 [Zychaea mexicana]